MKNYNNKICILLNWPREYDMYSALINYIPKKYLVLLINDIKTAESERRNSANEIKKILELKKFDYKFFSNEIHKSKYKILISTGESCSHKINIISIIKYLYGKTFGNILEKTKISNLFIKFFGKPFTANGTNAVPYMRWFPEKLLGHNTIKYPLGMDLNLRHYPNEEWKKYFDIFFTHGLLDTSLIKKKFKNSNCKIIGYPRYSELDSKEIIINRLEADLKLNINKKKIFWIPTHINFKNEILINIYPWIDKISELCKDFDVIVRPHPKSIKINSSIINLLSEKGFFVDQLSYRKIGNIFKISDLVLADYGGAVFSAIYMEKPLLLLNVSKDSKYIKEKKKVESLDLLVRNKIVEADISFSSKKIKQMCEEVVLEKYKDQIVQIKKEYFGDKENFLSSKEIANYLLNKLLN